MQFLRIGEFLAASRTTGPRHNLLQLLLTTEPVANPVCERLPPRGGCVHLPLREELVVAAVLEGILEANQELGTSYAAVHIRYVENDTRPEEIYGVLALLIVRHLVADGEFVVAVNS